MFSFSKKLSYKSIIFPVLASISFLKFPKNNCEKNKAFCGHSNDEEEKTSTSRTINQRISKIEQKLDFLIERENLKVDSKDYPRFNKNCSSLLKKVLDESTWRRNYFLLTEEGFNINDVIQVGLDNADHPIGLVAPSKDAYFTFEDVLVTAASSFHNRNLRLTKFERESYTLLKNIINTMEDLLKSTVTQAEITTNRNLEGFSFSSKINRSGRREVARNVLQVLKSEESGIFEESGKFLSLDNSEQMFTQNPFFRSCGFYRDWPDARFMYVNNEQSLTLIVNQEDHIKVTQKSESSENIVKYILNYFDLIDKLQAKLDFAYDDNLGFLNSLVNNIGSGTYFSIKLKVNKPEELKSHFKNTPECEVNIDKDGFVEISNVTSFYTFSQFLYDLVSAKHLLSN